MYRYYYILRHVLPHRKEELPLCLPKSFSDRHCPLLQDWGIVQRIPLNVNCIAVMTRDPKMAVSEHKFRRNWLGRVRGRIATCNEACWRGGSLLQQHISSELKPSFHRM